MPSRRITRYEPTTQDLPVEPRVLTYVMQIGLITLRRNHRFDK